MDHSLYLGIDVSKATLDVVLLSEPTARKGRHSVFANTIAGHEQLVTWLQSYGEVSIHACLEATGTYGQGVARALHEAGHGVSLVNPAQVSAFGKSGLKRTKTDKADALLIARFCALHKPALWTPPPAELEELQGLVRRIESLEEMKRMETNRLESATGQGATGERVRASLVDHIAYLQQQLDDTDKQIRSHIKANPSLREQSALLCSIPGIGEQTAALILAELGVIEEFEGARQVAAFAGLAPRLHQSGSSVRGQSRLCKVGSARLRKGLFFPAMSAVRCNPFIKALAARLTAQGKCKMVILGAAMRKLLHIAYGVLKSKQPFDQSFVPQNP